VAGDSKLRRLRSYRRQVLVGASPLHAPGHRYYRGTGVALALAVLSVIAVGPFFYVLSISFRNSLGLFNYPPHWLPVPFIVSNYERLTTQFPFWRWIGNTLLVATSVTLIKVVIDSMAGYAFAKLEFAGRRVAFGVILLTLMVPQAMLLIPLFFIVRDLGIYDTYWALILPPLANPIGVFMLRAFIRGLPKDVENAARVDNCNEFQIYRHVVLPLIKPGLVVVATITFVAQFSSFVWPLVGTQSANLQVITVGLSTLTPQGGTSSVPYGLIAAGSVLSTVVITGVFLILQRQFKGASLIGALKG
jgi:ABC-type glycerol-3-phosphate transport system permease component